MRNYKRKTNRGQTPEDVMERATEAVVGEQSVRSAAKDFAIKTIHSEERHTTATGYWLCGRGLAAAGVLS